MPIKRIGIPSDNGFVNEFAYERNGYVANAILKSSSRTDSDNLLYEYLVGQYINKQCRLYPCFVETYGWFTYNTPELWEIMKKNSNTIKDPMTNYIQLQSPKMTPESLNIACTQSKYLALLIQHIKDAKSLESMSSEQIFVKNQYIDYHYKLSDGTSIRFKCCYIAKIIDYGRSFFVDKEDRTSSNAIYKKICKTKKCKPNCGEDFGFTILECSNLNYG